MSESCSRRLRRGGAPQRKARNRLSSVSCSNEESTEGEEECSKKKMSVERDRVVLDHPKDSDRGLRKRSIKSNGLKTPLADEDIIDGFMILSFVTYEDLEKDTKGREEKVLLPDVGPDILPDGVNGTQSEGETKEEENTTKDDTLVVNGLDKVEEDGENNNEPTTPNQNYVLTLSEPPFRSKKAERMPRKHEAFNKNCDTAEESKKVPPDLEVPTCESTKQDTLQVQNKTGSPFPLKNANFHPLQNGPLQPEPSAAVAAVTVPASSNSQVPTQLGSSNPAPLPSSTSPTGGVPFPSSLLSQEEFSVSHTSASKTVTTQNAGPKSYDTIVKSPRGPNSDALPYPISSTYSEYSYTANQYSNGRHSQEGIQRTNHQKFVNNNYYNHHPQPDKYLQPKELAPRIKDPTIYGNLENCLDNRYEGKDYTVGQVYTNDKTCDPQTIYKKSNNIYNYKTNELLTQHSNENIKGVVDKAGGKLTGDLYGKGKVPNRTTYYQSIVNKSHSRHKSSRRVLPASAYENSKLVINNYKPEVNQVQPNKPVQYSSHNYTVDNKKQDYYQNQGNTNVYNCNSYKSENSHLSNNVNHNSYPIESNPRSYKTSSDHTTSSYREKQQAFPRDANSGTKSYNLQQTNRNFVDASTKVSDTTRSPYTNSDYYSKGNATYSRTGNSQSTINETQNKTPNNYSSDHSNYQSKSLNYHSRSSNEKSSRNFYPNHEGSYKSYRQDLVPKQNSEDPQAYRNPVNESTYQNYSNSSTVKTKETEQSKCEPVPNIVEANPHPVPISDISSYHSTSARDKTTFYPYSDQSQYTHRRTPPPSIPSVPSKPPPVSFESNASTNKDTEAFTHLNSSSATTISPSSSFNQRPVSVVSPPITVSDTSRQTSKTLWSPTATTALVTNTTNREIITTSSRDSHSSHSNSSISSLSQLSQSLGPATQGPTQNSKEFSREGKCSRSSSRNETPVCSATTLTTSTTTGSSSASSYGVSGSLTSLIFSKPSWTSPSVSTVLTNPTSHFTPPASGRIGSPVPSVLPLAPSLPSGQHSSPFGGPHVMFAPPLVPPTGSLSSPSLPLANTAGPSPFGGDSLFAPPPTNPDLLNIRRELDTRFLASQDRSINVPPPPYLRTEMHQHQHQHTHMHQHSPFLPPPLGGSLLPPSAAHLYDKYPKVDSSFYGRNALGLPTYPLSPLLAPGSATATPTPFAPPGHMAAFQPKISPMVKTKTLKSGRWCAMHVRISWEIYHHQQKHQAESQKGGSGPTKTVNDLLGPPNHLFGSIPRPHELGFSSPLLGAAASIHGRSPYDVSPQHPSFLGPTPAHLGMTPFARPGYPGLGNSFGAIGSLAGLTGPSMLAGRELPPGYLGMTQDPWSRLHRTPPNFPSPSAMNASSWGGLKAEAERDRLQKREDQEREKEKEKQKRVEQEKREKESEKSKEIARESKKEHEKQKERDRDSRVSHIQTNPDTARNGETADKSSRDKDWERDRARERRESSRSPIRTHKPEGGFEGNNPPSHKSDIKVKEEKREEELNRDTNSILDRERTKSNEPSHQDLVADYMARGMIVGLPMGLGPAEQARLNAMSQVPPHHFWNPHSADRYRNLEFQHEREQLMQKYASLSSVMPLLPERYRDIELARHLSSSEAAAREVERQLQADRDRQVYERSKLAPPPLRPNDPPYVSPQGLPPGGGLFPSLSNPFLNTLCASNYPPRTKPGSPGGIINGVPPPLIPCGSQGGSPVAGSTTPSPLQLKPGATTVNNVENTRELYPSKELREMSSHPPSDLESQSR